MAWLDIFRGEKKATAHVAKDRLKVIVAAQRQSANAPDWLPALQADVLAAIRKYVPVPDTAVDCQVEKNADTEVLELNVTLPTE